MMAATSTWENKVFESFWLALRPRPSLPCWDSTWARQAGRPDWCLPSISLYYTSLLSGLWNVDDQHRSQQQRSSSWATNRCFNTKMSPALAAANWVRYLANDSMASVKNTENQNEAICSSFKDTIHGCLAPRCPISPPAWARALWGRRPVPRSPASAGWSSSSHPAATPPDPLCPQTCRPPHQLPEQRLHSFSNKTRSSWDKGTLRHVINCVSCTKLHWALLVFWVKFDKNVKSGRPVQWFDLWEVEFQARRHSSICVTLLTI